MLHRPLKANGIAGFLKLVKEIRQQPGWFRRDPQWEPWFRGHEKAAWELKPQLYRTKPYPNLRLREVEDEIREEFIKRAPIMCEASPAGNEDRAEWEWYFMMQHHHAATRLLDWTDGALIALYFAVKHNRGDADAAVWVLDPYSLNNQSIGKEWVIPPSATGLDAKMGKKLKKWLPARFPDEYRALPRQAVAIEPTHLIRRMSSQHSCFTIHGSDPHALDNLEGMRRPCLFKIIIPRSAVREIEMELRCSGIDESTIFPDLDGLGRSINARWSMGKAWKEQKMPHQGVYARIRSSKIHGVGVFAIRDIPKKTKLFQEDEGELIWMTKGELNLNDLPDEIRLLYNQFCLIKDKGQEYGCPESFNLMTVAWYLNHSKTPNVGCDKDYAFYALRDIRKDEELTADYHTYNEFVNTRWV